MVTRGHEDGDTDVGTQEGGCEGRGLGCTDRGMWDMGCGATGPWGRDRVPPDGRDRGGCWASRSGGCVTWTAPGSAACPATPSPAWMAARLPRATTSGMARPRQGHVSLVWAQPSTALLSLCPRAGTPGTTAGRMAPSAAPSPRPSASASTSWCMATYVGDRGALWGPWWGEPPTNGVLCTPRLGSSGSSPPSSTQWQLSPPLVW